MTRRPFKIVTVAASLGGLQATRQVLGRLPADFPAAVVLVQHRGKRDPSRLASLLGRSCSLPVTSITEPITAAPGRIYVAPPDRQLRVRAGRRFHLGEFVPAFPRPCLADVTFESVAEVYGPTAIALVLTGLGRDGAHGVRQVKLRGGRVIVQSEETCQAPEMPRAALATGCVDLVLPPAIIASAVIALVMQPGVAELFRVPVPSWVLSSPLMVGPAAARPRLTAGRS